MRGHVRPRNAAQQRAPDTYSYALILDSAFERRGRPVWLRRRVEGICASVDRVFDFRRSQQGKGSVDMARVGVLRGLVMEMDS